MSRLSVVGLVALGALVAASVARVELGGEALTDLAVGRLIVAARAVPARDPLTFTAGATPWIASSFLGQSAAFAAWRAGGFRGVALLHAALLLAASAVTFALASRRASPLAALVVTVFVAPALLAVVPAATGAWSALLLAVALLAMERLRDAPTRGGALWLGGTLVAAGLLDAGFVAVFGAVFVALVASLARPLGRRTKVLAAALVVGAGGVALLHPSGLAALAHPLDHLRDRKLRELFFLVPALRGPSFIALPGRLVEAPLVVVLALALTGRFRPRRSDALLLLAFAHAAFTIERAVPFFILVAAPPLAVALAPLLPREGPRRRALVGTLLAALVAGGLLARSPLEPAQSEALEAAARIVLLDPKGALWCEPAQGGALEWAFEGRRLVWIDERRDLFAAADLERKHSKIHGAWAPWEDLIDRHHIDIALVELGSPLDEALRRRSWRVDYVSPCLRLLVRP